MLHSFEFTPATWFEVLDRAMMRVRG